MNSADTAFAGLDAWLRKAMAALEPGERQKLFREMARELRKRNQQRITRQAGPDGQPWEPRKRNAKGRVRSTAKMLIGLRAVRRMVISADGNGAEIGYRGRNAQIAAVHHHGHVDNVAPNGPRVKYPARQLLGLSVADLDWARARILEHLSDAMR
nr:phage virion morphogenesis protein [Telmatospirillum sp. J64-1]